MHCAGVVQECKTVPFPLHSCNRHTAKRLAARVQRCNGAIALLHCQNGSATGLHRCTVGGAPRVRTAHGKAPTHNCAAFGLCVPRG